MRVTHQAKLSSKACAPQASFSSVVIQAFSSFLSFHFPSPSQQACASRVLPRVVVCVGAALLCLNLRKDLAESKHLITASVVSASAQT